MYICIYVYIVSTAHFPWRTTATCDIFACFGVMFFLSGVLHFLAYLFVIYVDSKFKHNTTCIHAPVRVSFRAIRYQSE